MYTQAHIRNGQSTAIEILDKKINLNMNITVQQEIFNAYVCDKTIKLL